MDLSSVTAELANISGNIELIGTGMLIAAAVAVAFKWAKASIFG